LGADPLRAPRRWRTRVGAVMQLGTETGELTVREMVTAYAAYYPSALEVDALLEALDLGAQADRRIRHLSGGQRRRLDLALGLIGDPELLFLDEPTTGLDPEVRKRIWEFVSFLSEKGTTIVLTTHYLEEAEQLADRVAILVGGRVVASGPPDELGGAPKTEITFRRAGPIATAALPLELTATTIEDTGSTVQVTTEDSATTVGQLAAWASGLGAELTGLAVERKSLERTYLDLIAAHNRSPEEVSP
jgi:ABC-2 type transport system ATP-binding protein